MYKMYIFWTLWWYLWCKVHIAVSEIWYVLGRGIQNYELINTSCIAWNEIVSNCRYVMLLQLGRIMCYRNIAYSYKNYRHVNCQVLLHADSSTAGLCKYLDDLSVELRCHFSVQAGNFRKWWKLFWTTSKFMAVSCKVVCTAQQTSEHRELYGRVM